MSIWNLVVKSRCLPQWSSQDNPALVSASFRDLTAIEIYWLKGKSYWVLYALRRRLAEGKPVIWYRASTRFLFVNEGVYETPKDFLSTDLNTRVWTLVDSDE